MTHDADDELRRVIQPDGDAPVPGDLYKYRSLAQPKWVRELVVDQRLYFPKASALNDPFDCNPTFDTTATLEERRRYLRGFVTRTMKGKPRPERRRFESRIRGDMPTFIKTMTRSHAQTMENLGVYSLSAEPLDLLMWPHYADDHRGICVRFSMAGLLNEGHVPIPVTYAQQRPVVNPIIEEPEASAIRSIQTKALAWACEKEWRVVENMGGGKVVQLKRDVIDGVILGARITDENRAMVLEWVREAGRPIEVVQARFHSREYALETVPKLTLSAGVKAVGATSVGATADGGARS